MKAEIKGSLYSVTVSRDEVETFKRRWPCSKLPNRAITFWFDRLSGDLVDIMPMNVTDGADLLALSIDAQAHGMQHTRSTEDATV